MTLDQCFSFVQSAKYKSVLQSAQKLQFIDVAVLITMEQKLCFYINLLNLMLLHGLIWTVELEVQKVSTYYFT